VTNRRADEQIADEQMNRSSVPVHAAIPTEAPAGELWRWLVTRTGHLLLIHLALVAFQLGAGALAARSMGRAEFGSYSYAFTWVYVLGFVGLLRADILATRLVAVFHEQRQWGLLRGALVRLNRTALASTCLVAGIAALIGFTLVGRRGSFDPVVFAIGAAAVPLFGAAQLREAILRGLRRVTTAMAATVFVGEGLILTLIAVVALTGAHLDAERGMGIVAAGRAALVVCMVALVRRCLPREVRSAEPETRDAEWLRSLLPLALGGALLFVKRSEGVLLLGMFEPDESVAVYAAAQRLSAPLEFLLTASNLALAPLIARLHARGDATQLQNLVSRVALAITAVTCILYATMFALAGPLLSLFGDGFDGGQTALRVLGAAQLFNVVAGPVALALWMTGNDGPVAWVTAIAVLLGIAVGWLAIPAWGVEGAAAVDLAIEVFWNATLAVLVWRRLRLHTSAPQALFLRLARRSAST
jgi:O-antigen/teichoic acid export membrane protein